MDKQRPVSPVNGVPLPEGRPFTAGEVAREAGRKGGYRAAEVKRRRKTLKKELSDLLEDEISTKTGEKLQTQKALSLALIKQALGGSVRAFEVIRDTIGERPPSEGHGIDADMADDTNGIMMSYADLFSRAAPDRTIESVEADTDDEDGEDDV